MQRYYLYSPLSIPVFGLLYLHTAVMVVLCLFFAYLKMRIVVKSLVQFWAHSVFWIIGKKVKISGKENMEANKRYILLANHASLFAIMAIMSFFPGVSWFGRERLLKVPLWGRILKMIDYIPMKSGNIRNTKDILRQLIQKSKGNSIAIFPEGTRTKDGQIHRFHKGFMFVQRASEMDILPVTLNGFFRLKPKSRLAIDFSIPLEVIIHKPIKNSELKDKTDVDNINRVSDVIKSAYRL